MRGLVEPYETARRHRLSKFSEGSLAFHGVTRRTYNDAASAENARIASPENSGISHHITLLLLGDIRLIPTHQNTLENFQSPIQLVPK